MSLADIEIFEDWGTLDETVDATISAVAKATLDKCRKHPNDPQVVLAALNHLYQEWKRVDEEQSTDAREAIGEFMTEIVENTDTGLEPDEVWEEISMGLFGEKIATEKAILSKVSQTEIDAIVKSITQKLSAQQMAHLPFFGAIRLKKRPAQKVGSFELPAKTSLSFTPSEFSRENIGTTKQIPAIDYQSERMLEKGEIIVKPEVQNPEKVLKTFIDAINEALITGPIAIAGFGTFTILKFPSYKSVNPRTEEQIIVPEKRLLGIKFDSSYRRQF